MIKHQYLVTGTQFDRDGLKKNLFKDLEQYLASPGIARVKVTITEEQPPRLCPIPFKNEPLALVSLWLKKASAGNKITEAFNESQYAVSGYRVAESEPVECQKTWPDRDPSPGVVLLTLLVKNSSLTYDEFMKEWFGKHTPMSIEIHPMAHYIRNVVEATTIDGSYPFEGIVEERFSTKRELIRPSRMFGGLFSMVPNMIRIGRHVNHFLDLKLTETYYMREYCLKS